MRRTVGRALRALPGWLGAAALGILAPPEANAQSPFGVATAALSSDTVAVGEAFELVASFDVAPGTIVYFPDTVASTESVESLAPARWTAESGPAGGARLTLRYPLMAFRGGSVAVPGFDVLAVPAGAREGPQALPGGSSVAPWSDAPLEGDGAAARLRFARRGLWVTSTLTPEQLVAGVEPMPPGDVVGSSWHWPSVGLALLFSTLLLGIAVSIGTGRRVRPDEGPAGATSPPEDPRLAALAELDRLLASGPPDEARVREVYARSSAAVRSYVEPLDPAWGPGLTSSELMERLGSRWRDASVDALHREMSDAEVVKFGRRRPAASATEAHLRALRRWVAGSDPGVSVRRVPGGTP